MSLFYIPKHFDIKELVDENTFNNLGEKAWSLFNPYALISLDSIREYFNTPVYVNNWHNGGVLQFRGFRPFDCTVGSNYSQHRLGNSFDLNIKDIPAEEARKVILKNKNNIYFRYITTLESGVSWVHFDCRMIKPEERILLVHK